MGTGRQVIKPSQLSFIRDRSIRIQVPELKNSTVVVTVLNGGAARRARGLESALEALRTRPPQRGDRRSVVQGASAAQFLCALSGAGLGSFDQFYSRTYCWRRRLSFLSHHPDKGQHLLPA
jgi:hypothetical protein